VEEEGGGETCVGVGVCVGVWREFHTPLFQELLEKTPEHSNRKLSTFWRMHIVVFFWSVLV
jgi:hypothetical protein